MRIDHAAKRRMRRGLIAYKFRMQLRALRRGGVHTALAASERDFLFITVMHRLHGGIDGDTV